MQLQGNSGGPYTVPGFAAKYHVCRNTVYNWIASGIVGSVKIGGSRRILPEHEQAFIARITEGDQGGAS